MSRLLRLLAALAALLAWCAPASADTATATAGAVRADLEWEAESPSATAPKLRITRDGVVSEHAPAECAPGEDQAKLFCERPFSRRGDDVLHVLDLDGDAEPEVIVELFSGGAHCCTASAVLRWDAAASRYAAARHEWADAAFTLRDVDRDGRIEFVSGDARFAYAFGSFAEARFPIQVFSFTGGEYEDVSAGHPAVLRADARALWRDYRMFARRGYNVRTVLAAYLADRYRLGEAAAGSRRVRRELAADGLSRSDRRYLRRVKRFLVRLGYAGSADFRTARSS